MMIAAYRAARLNQRLNLRAASVPQQHDQLPSTTLDEEASGPSPAASIAPPPVQQTAETAPLQAFAETNRVPLASEPVISDPNDLAQTQAMTALDPLPEDVVARSHLPSLIAPAESAFPAPVEPLIAPTEPATLSPAELLITHAEPAVDTSRARTAPALAGIGLGPCMLLRLNQIGLKSVDDVAQAKPDELRAALGSSRLLNVEAWISNARHLTATGFAA